MGIILCRMFGRIESHAIQAADLEISREISSRTASLKSIIIQAHKTQLLPISRFNGAPFLTTSIALPPSK